MKTTIDVRLEHSHLDNTLTLHTVGMVESGMPELRLEHLPEMGQTPCKHLVQLMRVLARECIHFSLEADTVVSMGDYGHIRLESGKDKNDKSILLVRDVEIGKKDANSFVGRLMALTGFEHMDGGSPSEAVECFNVALHLQPDDAVLLQARASAKHDLLLNGEKANEAGELMLTMLDDIFLSIQFAPDRPEAYKDLLAILQSLSPQGIDQLEYHQWLSEVVGAALSYPTDNPAALAEREALKGLVSRWA